MRAVVEESSSNKPPLAPLPPLSWLVILMRCDEVDILISDYSVGGLSKTVEVGVREHVAACPKCARELDRLMLVMSAVEEDFAPVEPPPGLWHGVYNRIAERPIRARRDYFGYLFLRSRRLLSLGVGAVALAGALIFGISIHKPDTAQLPEPAAVEYVQSHIASSANDPFADRVSLGFVESLPSAGGRGQL